MNPPPFPAAAELALDEALEPFGAFLVALSVAAQPTGDAALDETMHVARLRLSLPCELGFAEGPDGRLALGGAPPTQYTETSVMPVFHRIEVTVTRVDAENEEAEAGPNG